MHQVIGTTVEAQGNRAVAKMRAFTQSFKLPAQDWNGAKSTLSVKIDLTTSCRRTPLVIEKFIIARYSQKTTI
ncbi:hypothetical protein I312_106596 [Cryptococcus bacillisporus CA1280]|uniref:uncharacterized protein n=1 Tax=Cryptococcus bacillisporus CA1280 TaxID=1296109 RepID=UPI0033688409